MRLIRVSMIGISLVGCLSDPVKKDPYAGMDCDQKITSIAREVQEFQKAQGAVPKASAQTSNLADTTKSDSTKKIIIEMKPYPPVAGMDGREPKPDSSISDSRNSAVMPPGFGSQLYWIPPVGFDSGEKSWGAVPVISTEGRETTSFTAMPNSISAVQIISDSAYTASIRIYDRHEKRIREFDQNFGFKGELSNANRKVPGGYVSYLVWDNKDASGKTVPTGVYLWKVNLASESGMDAEITMKIGYVGEECLQTK